MEAFTKGWLGPVVLAALLSGPAIAAIPAPTAAAAALAGTTPRPPARHVLDSVRVNDVAAVREDLDRRGSRAARAEQAGWLLPAAAEAGRLEIVNLLLEAGAAPDALSDFSGGIPQTALELAARGGHVAVCRRLLDAGADPNAPTVPPRIPALMAALPGPGRTSDTAQLLIERGADPFVSDRHGNSAFRQALNYRLENLALLMLASTNAAPYLATNGPALLNQAVAAGLAGVAEKLLNRGVNPNALNATGVAPLQLLALGAMPGGYGVSLSADKRARLRQALVGAGARTDAFAATAFNDTNAAQALISTNPACAQNRDAAGRTPLHWAVLCDSAAWLDFWLAHGAAPDATNTAGRTALHLAVEAGQASLVDHLLLAGANPGLRDTNNLTALDLATAQNHAEIAGRLLKAAGVSLSNGRGPTLPLHRAITANNSNRFATALAMTADLNAPDELGLTPLHLAVRKGHLPFMLALLRAGADVNAIDTDGNTPLHTFLFRRPNEFHPLPPGWLDRAKGLPMVQSLLPGWANRPPPSPRLQVVRVLLAYDADPNRTNRTGVSSAQLAARNVEQEGSEESIALAVALRKAGGNLDALDEQGEAAIHRAARQLQDSKLPALLRAGASPNARDARRRTPLHIAVENVFDWIDDPASGYVIPVKALLAAGADPNAQDNEGLTPLHALILSPQDGTSEACAALLRAGADPDRRDRQGRTPLHLLLGRGWMNGDREAVLNQLLAAGADRNAVDADGRTPLHYAGALGSVPTGSLDAGVRLDQQDRAGDTALHVAARAGNGDCYAALRAAGACADLTNHAGETPLLLLAQHASISPPADDDLMSLTWKDDTARIDRLLTLEPRLVKLPNRRLNSPVLEAALAGKTNVIAVLLQHGAGWDVLSAALLKREGILRELLAREPGQVTNQLYGSPLLQLVARSGSTGAVMAVLSAGADINAWANDGATAWGVASRVTNTAVTSLLRDRGIQPSLFDAIALGDADRTLRMLRDAPTLATQINRLGVSAAHAAVAQGSDDTLEAMLRNGLPPEFTAAGGLTLLDVAAIWNRAGCAQRLLQHGAEVEAFDHAGLTPLHWAARECSIEVARVLLAAGASPSRRTRNIVIRQSGRERDEFTPLHEAASAGVPRMVELLVQAGADLNDPDGEGRTAWDLAQRIGYRSGGIGPARLAQVGPLVLLDTHLHVRPTVERAQERRETIALIESLGGMPSQGQRSKAVPGTR